MTTATMNAATSATLSEDLIGRCGNRAATYDRENRFFTEDFDELRAAGYLKSAVPKEFGGAGMSLADVCREQRRLAYRAPATALATNMSAIVCSASACALTPGVFVTVTPRARQAARSTLSVPAPQIEMRRSAGQAASTRLVKRA